MTGYTVLPHPTSPPPSQTSQKQINSYSYALTVTQSEFTSQSYPLPAKWSQTMTVSVSSPAKPSTLVYSAGSL